MSEAPKKDAAQIARGRRIILATISVSLFLAAADIALAIVADRWNPGLSLIRLAFLGLLLWAMFRGRAWARLIFLVLVMVGMAFAGAIAIEPPKVNTDAARIFSACVIAVGAGLVWFLSFDKSVVRYEQAQLARFPRLFGADGGRRD
jgi:hypothetical protein